MIMLERTKGLLHLRSHKLISHAFMLRRNILEKITFHSASVILMISSVRALISYNCCPCCSLFFQHSTTTKNILIIQRLASILQTVFLQNTAL